MDEVNDWWVVRRSVEGDGPSYRVRMARGGLWVWEVVYGGGTTLERSTRGFVTKEGALRDMARLRDALNILLESGNE